MISYIYKVASESVNQKINNHFAKCLSITPIRLIGYLSAICDLYLKPLYFNWQR